MQFKSHDWFPSGIVTEIERTKDVSDNLSKFKVHTKHGTINMVWPTIEPTELEFWNNLKSLIDCKEIKSWGIASKFDFNKIDAANKVSDGNKLIFLLNGEERILAKYNPFLIANRETRLKNMEIEDFGIKILGGLKLKKHDLILFYEEQMNDVSFEDTIKNLLLNSDMNDLKTNLIEIGKFLGKFHIKMNENLAPPIPEKWNERLKRLEHITSSNTLWRAPHSKFTEAIWTHGNLSLNRIVLDNNNNWRLTNFEGNPLQQLIDSTVRFPAIRDIASLYWSISKLLYELEIEDDTKENDIRRWLFEGWSSVVPKKWSNSDSLDTHKGGILIWEYDCALCELFLDQAFAKKNNFHTTNRLSNVTRVQTLMFKNRLYSALSKITLLCGFLLFFGWNTIDKNLILIGVFIALIMSFIFKKIYHYRAPRKW